MMKKFNWGHGILIGIICFMSGIITMVYISMKQNNSTQLIEENYYEKELVFQQQIDAERNLKALYPDTLILNDTEHQIYIKLPQAAHNVDSGYLEFVRPSDKTMDRRLDIVANHIGEIKLPKEGFVDGLYKFKIRWSSNGTTYMKIKDFVVNE